MKTIKLWRTFKEGVENYRRNGWLTFATVSILALSLSVIGFAALVGFAGSLAVRNLENKISISVSFRPDVSESRILQIRDDLSKYREIASVTYVSKEKALEEFLKDGNPAVADAVETIGENPLLSSLSIRANEPKDYDLIAEQIRSSAFRQDIEEINYERNRKRIDGLNELTSRARTIGLGLGAMFVIIGILITFNTIRLTIYSHRQEFEVMRLVGASNLYIRMPLFFEGVFYGLTAATVTVLLLTALAAALSGNAGPFLSEILGGKTFFRVYLSFLWVFVPGTVIAGVVLGVVSSLIAIRRYLRI
ncbi:MAG: ABC transporter permease [Candidatus Moranbacteria bacterium]|nr:ABC transporter permease [Candidatus Moranbacteria bacterium]NTW45699.1 ABC transporter permease [Candidatus Moranbacteria bacterium]